MKDDPTCPLCRNKQTTEHVLSSCRVALSQSRYTWRLNRVLQELAIAIWDAKGLHVRPKARALVFTSEDGKKSWYGTAAGMDTQRKSPLGGCDDSEFSANLPEWNKHPKVIQDRRMRPAIAFHSNAAR
ncbi:reverse transcriptase [Plakobranchus ocellatus]|uniref:Reverse transcriptase n=1 Tax=Plakobranchus ocellatus TaxID=259542 RepID=A0AAV3Y1Z8_9GAST|nr:reverse transcriptase [Plakobranchus ocellatus]